MDIKHFLNLIGADFFVGVPDSQLRPLCDYLMSTYGIDSHHHIIAANEGNCTAIAAGYHLATGKTPVVYMQNSGIGNIINPVASLLNEKVYAIPCIFIVGWRGEPNVHDEPQHIFQGEVTERLLEDCGIRTFIVSKDTSEEQIADKMDEWRTELSQGHQVAFIVRKGALETPMKQKYGNHFSLNREETIAHIVKFCKEDLIVSTTGKISRELFEIREKNGQTHEKDFLTVGSMGHCSSIALGVALNRPEKKVWCIDGDGAVLMHMGAMAVIGKLHPNNFIHIVLNNGAHETVGGMPTVASGTNFVDVALACGYTNAVSVASMEALDIVLKEAAEKNELSFIEVEVALGARSDLGRPTTNALDNKLNFMKNLNF